MGSLRDVIVRYLKQTPALSYPVFFKALLSYPLLGSAYLAPTAVVGRLTSEFWPLHQTAWG